MKKKLILHDLSPTDAKNFLPAESEEYILFSATPPVRGCVGCFGCWIRTPGRCVIADRGADFVRPLSLCDEFIVVSRMTFGGLSPDIKAVLDRSIGVVMPFFRYVDDEMHHTKRYNKTPGLRYLFYGTDMMAREKATAEKLAVANQINLGFGNPSAEFFATARECTEALNAQSVEGLRPDADAQVRENAGSTGGERADGNGDSVVQSDANENGGSAVQSGANENGDTAARVAGAASNSDAVESVRVKKVALINGSPKPKSSASKLMLEALWERIGSSSDCAVVNAAKQERDEIISAITGSDALVFIFPLYVDGIPSHLLKILDEACGEIAEAAPGAMVYAVMNNGFYEGRQNTLAFEMMRSFANRAGLSWGGAIGVGAGGMIHALTIGKGPLKKLGVALDSLTQKITTRAAADDCTLDPALPRYLYKAAAHNEWRKVARKNGLKVKQLYRK
jgi:multimeric flavodoxin WrbA